MRVLTQNRVPKRFSIFDKYLGEFNYGFLPEQQMLTHANGEGMKAKETNSVANPLNYLKLESAFPLHKHHQVSQQYPGCQH